MINDKNKIFEELSLYLGQTELPENLRKAIEEDEEVRQYWEELQALGDQFGTDEDFVPDHIDTEQFVADLNRRIDVAERTSQVPKTTVTYFHGFYKWAGVAAMFVLVAGISLVGLYFGRDNGNNVSVNLDNRTIAYYFGLDNDAAYTGSDSSLTLSDGEFQVLVDDYVSQEPYQSLDGVIDDISEEEFEYLQKNFDVGDLL